MSDTLFDMLMTLDILAGVTSILSLSAISIERMTAVKYPTRHMNMTNRPVLIAIATTWLCGFTLSQTKHLITTSTVRTYTGLVFVCGYIVPLTVIVVAYVVIYNTACNMITANIDTKTSREIKLAKTISFIIGLFLICWTPFFLVNMIYVFCESSCFHPGGNKPTWPIHVSKILHYSNSMMNFIVYGFRSPDFGQFFRRALCCSLKSRNGSVTTSQVRTRGLTVTEVCFDEYSDNGCAVTRPLTNDSLL